MTPSTKGWRSRSFIQWTWGTVSLYSKRTCGPWARLVSSRGSSDVAENSFLYNQQATDERRLWLFPHHRSPADGKWSSSKLWGWEVCGCSLHVSNNHIYLRSVGKHTTFRMFSDETLLSLARKIHLLDLKFYINLGDWPSGPWKVNETPGPIHIISLCGSLDSRDVTLPTYSITYTRLETMRGITHYLLSIQ